MKAVQGSRGSAEFPPPLRFCNCTEVVAVVHGWWLTIFGWLHVLSPSTVPVIWKCWGAAAHRACEGSSCQPQPADGPLCGPTTRIHTPQENVDFIIGCLKFTITWSQFMGPFYFWYIFWYIFWFAQLPWMAHQSSLGPRIVASFSWVFMGDSCWGRRG